MRISKIVYKGGMIKDLEQKTDLSEHVFNEDTLPKDILDLMYETKIMEIGGVYGDPKIGNPIQYDHLFIQHDENSTTIEAFNLAIFYMVAEDPYLRRIFQVMGQFQRLIRN